MSWLWWILIIAAGIAAIACIGYVIWFVLLVRAAKGGG